MKLPKLHYFDRSEFIRGEDWFTKMSPRLLVLLDTFRHLTGPCIISPNKDAIGRRDNTDSQHNIGKWGEVRAVDVFPTLEPKGLADSFPLEGDDDFYFMDAIADEWRHAARMINITGFGLYTDWKFNGKVRPGVHLDVRNSSEMVTWGRIDRNYVSLDKAMEELA